MAEAEGDERGGRLGPALATFDAALALAGRSRPPTCDLGGLRERRDACSLREARGRLAALDVPPTDPARAVGEALTLQARVAKDPALAEIGEPVGRAVERLRESWALADLAEAARAVDAGKSDRALSLCERIYRNADALPSKQANPLQSRAKAIARPLIAAFGVVVEPVRGTFTLGSPESYAGSLRELVQNSLRQRGYLPRPAKPVWTELWDKLAPFRVTFEVSEYQDDPYLASPNRVSRLEGRLSIWQDDVSLYRDVPIGRTEVPLPRQSAYASSRAASSSHRSSEFERMLYENAFSNFLDRVGKTLRNLPACPATATRTANSG